MSADHLRGARRTAALPALGTGYGNPSPNRLVVTNAALLLMLLAILTTVTHGWTKSRCPPEDSGGAALAHRIENVPVTQHHPA